MSEISDWRRATNGDWFRSASDGADAATVYRLDGQWHASGLRGVLLGCPDAAREAADAHLVSHGRLPSAQAFVRLGDWEERNNVRSLRPTSVWIRKRGGQPTYIASDDAERERLDVFLVARHALDPSRAFKATTENTPNTMTRVPPQMHNSVPPEVARAAKSYTIPTGYSPEDVTSKINADPNAPVTATVKHGALWLEPRKVGPVPAKATWGEWECDGGRAPAIRKRVGGTNILAGWGGWRDAFGGGGEATDIDDAREKADAWLVARGELEAGRAFKRVGDWQYAPAGSVRTSRQHAIRARNTPDRITGKAWEVFSVPGIRPVVGAAGPETGDAGKAAADAELVRRGLLAEERAFKVAEFPCVPIPANAPVTVAVHLHTGAITVECEKVIPFVVNTTRRGADYDYSLSDDSGAWIAVKPGDHVRYTVTDGRGAFAHRGTRTGGAPDPLAAGVRLDHDAAMYCGLSRKPGETDESLRARCAYVLRGAIAKLPSHGATVDTSITLATWEHHLPTLLDNAPREFRDGFNRRQGPAWDAYLRALAWVKEQIQCKRVGTPNVREAITMAALTAQGHLGPEWVKANVR